MRQISRGIFILGAILLPILSVAQGAKKLEDWTLEEVLAGIARANGGMESIERITNARFIGSATDGENTYEVMILKRRPNRIRSRMAMGDKVMETGYDGSIVWRRFEQGGHDRVVQVTDPEIIRNVVLEADFDGPLIGEPAEGLELNLLKVEQIDRVDYFVVEERSGHATTHHYIDSRTFRELKMVKTIPQKQGDPIVVTTTFHDVEKHDGIWVARRIEKVASSGSRESIQLNTIEMNPGILDFSFKMPEERNPIPGN